MEFLTINVVKLLSFILKKKFHYKKKIFSIWNQTKIAMKKKKKKKSSSKNLIKLFLKYLFDSEVYSEPMVGYPATHRRITLLPDKSSVYKFYSTGNFDGIFLELDDWIELVKSQPVTEKWFCR